VNKKIIGLFLLFITAFLVWVCMFPGTAHLIEIESKGIKKDSTIWHMLSREGFLTDPGKEYYKITCKVALKSNVPFPITPALKINAPDLKIKAFLMPFSVCRPLGNVIFPFEKTRTVQISPFGKFKGVFIFIVETRKNIKQEDLMKSFSFSVANCGEIRKLCSEFTRSGCLLSPEFSFNAI